MSVQTDGSSAAAETCSVTRSADGRLFHTVGPWKAKLRWPTDVRTIGRSTHPVDADRSGRRPWTFSTGTQNSCRYGGATPRVHFHTRTAVLKMILRRTGSHWRLRRNGMRWTRRRASDIRRAAILTAAVVFKCYPASRALQ